jgi:acyl carrier protein
MNPKYRMNNILSEKDTLAIQDIIIRQLDVQRDQLTPEARILADLGADSLDVVEISMTLEELFEVSIPDEQWDKVETVGELYDELGRILQQRTHAS